MIRILVIDDSRADQVLVERGLRRARVANELYFAEDGEAALRLLESERLDGLPDLILLDLNMPRMDGREFLELVKSHARFRRIPVVILTSSNAHTDIEEAYAHHCAGYIRKPIGVDELIEVCQEIGRYWVALVELPERD